MELTSLLKDIFLRYTEYSCIITYEYICKNDECLNKEYINIEVFLKFN